MKIGILQTGHAPDEVKGELGDYADMFARLLSGRGFEFEAFYVVDGQFPSGPTQADGWLITGSKHAAYEDHDWIAPLESLIRDIRDSGHPLIGICFGHQIIAQALGGKVEKFAGGWAVGPQSYDFEGETLSLNAWHQDQVTQLPDGAEVIASNDFCENAALMVGENILSIQPHPEFDAVMIEKLITHRGRGNVPADLLDQAENALHRPTSHQAFANRMDAHFRKGER